MITKNTIIITSLGRTGTEFFSTLYKAILPDCTSLHEPDVIKFTEPNKRFKIFIDQIAIAGPYRMIILKLLKKWSIANISDARFLGKIDHSTTVTKLIENRNGFISGLPGSTYVESNLGFYGLLDITPDVFQNHKAIFIIRDGRDWIKSFMNWGELYDKKGIRKYFSHNWPDAKTVKGDPYQNYWQNMTRFEKLCWAWSNLNFYALKTLESNPDAMLIKFEDLFKSANRYRTLDELLNFTMSMPGINSATRLGTQGWLEQKIHQSSNKFPGWEQWNAVQKDQFSNICGSLMKSQGYW